MDKIKTIISLVKNHKMIVIPVLIVYCLVSSLLVFSFKAEADSAIQARQDAYKKISQLEKENRSLELLQEKTNKIVRDNNAKKAKSDAEYERIISSISNTCIISNDNLVILRKHAESLNSKHKGRIAR